MSKISLFIVRNLSIPFTAMLIVGIIVSIINASTEFKWLNTNLDILHALLVIGFIGTIICIVIANFIVCTSCGKKAIITTSTGFDIGHTIAIYHATACHHCGSKLE